MASTEIASSFPVFNDKSGAPLEDGYIYIGEANKNPEASPLEIFYDANLNIHASQPLRTIGGYISNNGTPANIYILEDNYSLTVKDKINELVYYRPSLNTPAQIEGSFNSVDSIAELLAIDISNTYQTVNVRGYYTANDGRGGIFNYDALIDKSTADGVKILDPDQTLPNQGNGIGFGCWRMQHDSIKGNIYPNPYSVTSPSGRQLVIGGVIRRNTLATDPSVVDANNWFFINNTAHLPLNIDMTRGDNANTSQGGCEVTADGIGVIVYYRGLRLHTFNVTPDETMAKKGVRIGNSGGNTYSILYFWADCSFTADLNTLAISKHDYTLWPATRFSVIVTSLGKITLRHPVINALSHTARVTYAPRSSVGSHFRPMFIESSSIDNTTTCFLMGNMTGTFLGDATGTTGTISNSESVDETEYTITWTSGTSVLRIDHPVLTGDTPPTVQLTSLSSSATSSTYIYTLLDWGSDFFEVIIKDAAGVGRTSTQYTKFAFNRGLSSKVSPSKIDGALNVELPNAEIYASELDSHTGNFWITGIMQD